MLELRNVKTKNVQTAELRLGQLKVKTIQQQIATKVSDKGNELVGIHNKVKAEKEGEWNVTREEK